MESRQEVMKRLAKRADEANVLESEGASGAMDALAAHDAFLELYPGISADQRLATIAGIMIGHAVNEIVSEMGEREEFGQRFQQIGSFLSNQDKDFKAWLAAMPVKEAAEAGLKQLRSRRGADVA